MFVCFLLPFRMLPCRVDRREAVSGPGTGRLSRVITRHKSSLKMDTKNGRCPQEKEGLNYVFWFLSISLIF